MNNNSQHNLQNRSLLRSNISNDEQASIIRYQENQNDLASWLKWVLKILALVLFLIIFLSLLKYGSKNSLWGATKRFITAPLRWFSWSHQEEKPCEIVKYVKETDKDLEEFKKVKELRRRLQLQGLSINTLLPQTPNLSYIKNHPHKYENITIMKQKVLSEELPPKTQLDNVIQQFNILLPYGNIYMDSTPEQQQEIKQTIERKIQNQKDQIEKIDNKFLENLQFNVQDLNESYKNFLIKREKIQNFRQQFQNIMKQLQQCQDDINQKKNLYNMKDLELNELQQKYKDLQNEINSLIAQLHDLQNALNQLMQQRDNELGGIRIKVKQFQHYVDNEPQIRRQIEQAQIELQNLKNSQPNLMKQIQDLINQKEQKQSEYDNLKQKLKMMDYKNEILEDKIKLHSDQLDAAYKNEQLHQYVLNLINKDTKMSYLASLMQKKVDQEKDLIKNVEKFKARMNEIEGELIVDIQKGIKTEEIIQAIEQDKQDFKNISKGYQELLQKINNLKDVKVEVNRLIVLKKKAQDELKQFQGNYNNMKYQLNKLKDDNIQLELRIKSLEDNYDKNKLYIDKQEKDIQEKIKNLQLALDQYNQIKSELDARELFYKDKIKDQNELIQSLQNKIDLLRKQLSDALNNITNLKPQVVQLQRDYELKEQDCSAFIQYFYETEKYVKKLEDMERNDKQKLQNLRSKINESLSVINEDINQ